MYQTILIESGFMLNYPKDFTSRIYSLVKTSVNIKTVATIEEEDDIEEANIESDMKDVEPSSNTEDGPKDYNDDFRFRVTFLHCAKWLKC